MMATFHRDSKGLQVAVKGAPDRVLEACTHVADDGGQRELDGEQRAEWQERAQQLAREGLRVLAVADKRVDTSDAEPYRDLRLVGLVGLVDPPRSEVRHAIEQCQRAGIRVVMVTGDQAATGQAIGEQVGLARGDEPAMHGSDLADPDELSPEDRRKILGAAVFARVSPEQKLNLVDIYQKEGEIIAMTGDGINDAPALKKADIGVAMGRRGTDAAKQVADMVLQDDAFMSIVAAVAQGRVIFGNIRKSVVFMLCTNGAEILAVTAASILNIPLPLRPLQILYLNVLTDVFPALALSVGKGTPHIMEQPPRDPRESVLTRHHWLAIAGWSILMAVCVMGALTAADSWLRFATDRAVTVSFLTLAFAKLWFVFTLRDRGEKRLDNDIVRNPWMWAALALCVTLLIVAVYWMPLSFLLSTQAPGWQGWTVILALSLIPAVVGLFAAGMRFHTATSEREEKEGIAGSAAGN